MRYTFLDLAKDVLSEKKVPLTIEEIWGNGKELGLTDKLGSNGKTPLATLQAKIYVDIKENKDNSIFIKVGKRPTKFFLRNLELNIDDEEIIDTQRNTEIISEVKEETEKVKERDLHSCKSSF
ncbi:MAG: winged helix-turn-helix domain-containing protein [Sarcina sp.]